MQLNDLDKIAKALEEMYEDEDIPEDNLPYLKEMLLSLPDFEIDEDEITKLCLEQILEHWLEIRN